MRAKRSTSIANENPKVRVHAASLLAPLSLLFFGLLIQGLAHAELDIIGEGAVKVKSKDYPAFCQIEIERHEGDETGNCSGTLVGPNEIATGAHCFRRDFNLNDSSVRVSCGNRSATVSLVELPAESLWVDSKKPHTGYDYARVTLKKSLDRSIPKATHAKLYFGDDKKLLPGVRCWMAGFGNSKSSNYGNLYIAEVTGQSIVQGPLGSIVLSDPRGGVLKTSVDHGDSGGSFYCQAPGQSVELVAVIVSYRAEERRDQNRLENHFAPIWAQSNLLLK